jgi:hypothetical protein
MKYWPLFCLLVIATLAATALYWNIGMGWMHYFMGFFLCQFAMLKLFRPKGFADGFQMYDLIGSRVRLYAYIYPLIELGLGLGYLSFFAPFWIYWITVIVLGIGAIGVILALIKGLNIRCVCMGTVLDVPLSTVTLIEDLVMVAMAGILLFN